jgi:hypothetical protein
MDFGTFCGQVAYFCPVWYIGSTYVEISGNPAENGQYEYGTFNNNTVSNKFCIFRQCCLYQHTSIKYVSIALL